MYIIIIYPQTNLCKLLLNLKKRKLRHCVIFPKGPPFSIVTAVTFHYRVREGSMWIHYAIKHLSQYIEIFKFNKVKHSVY